MRKIAFFMGALGCLALFASDVLIKAQDKTRKWTADNALLEYIPDALRVRIQADAVTSGTYSTDVRNEGRHYMQVYMGSYEYAIVNPVCNINGKPLFNLYSGYNTVVLPSEAKADFNFGITAQKEAAGKTGPWFDLRTIRFTDTPLYAPVVQLAKGEEVARLGGKLTIRMETEAQVAGGVISVRFFVGPSFIKYRFSKEEAVALKCVKGNIYEGTVTIDKDALSFSSKENPSFFISAEAYVHNKSCYYRLPFPIEVKTEHGIDMKQAPLSALHVRDAREQWADSTKGENLARGLRCELLPLPDYNLTTDDKDTMDLTDGKLTNRIDDKLWWDKDCIGWYGGSGHSFIKLDLGKEQPLKKAVIRIMGGTSDNFKFPSTITAHISKDGKKYYTPFSMQKLAPCESGQCDWKRYYYLDEERKTPDTRVHAFELFLNADARYVIIEIEGSTGAIFCDELAIIKAESKDKEFNSVYKETGKELPLEGLIIRPRVAEIAVIAGLPCPQALQITDMRPPKGKKSAPAEMALELPKGVSIINDKDFTKAPLSDGGMRYTLKLKENFKLGKTINSPVFFLAAALGTTGNVTIYGISEGVPQFKTTVPLKVVEAPKIEPFKRMQNSLAWMSDAVGQTWPDFFDNWRRLGFFAVSTFPRYWGKGPKLAAKQKFVDDAHKAGYKVIMNESCFHVMEKGKKAGDEIYCQVPGVPNKWLCPTYRGEAYQKEMARIAENVKNSKPDFVFYDIEIWGPATRSVPLCQRCRPLLEKSGKSLDEFLYSLGTEIMGDVKEAVRKGAEAAGIPMPVIGSYNRHAAAPKYAIENWNYLYPDNFKMAQPSLYVCGRAQDVHDCIRKNHQILGNRDIIPWLSTGTYGEFESYKVEQMVLEAIMNGAMGITYFCERNFYDSPLDFYYHAKALEALRPYEDLIMDAKLLTTVGDNKDMTYTLLQKGNEAMLLVGNYKAAPPKVTFLLPFKPKAIVDARTGEKIKPTGKKFTFDVPKNDVRLFYIK